MKKKAGKISRKAVAKKGDTSRERPKIPFEPFTFEQWTDADLHPPLVTMESKIAEFLGTARRESEWSAEAKAEGKINEARNCAAMAKASRAKAAKWRNLSCLPKAEDERLDRDCHEVLADGVDLLLARGQTSNEAKFWLSCIIGQAARGLLALAAHGDAVAATKLIAGLLEAVTGFEFLAWHRPELFTHYTRRLALIPATISRRGENEDACKELMRKLEAGTHSMFPIVRNGKGREWRESNPANALALRLHQYITKKRGDFGYLFGHFEIYGECPCWFRELGNLENFGKETWKKWAEVAWKILDDGKHPALHDERTKICNLRKKRKSPYPTKDGKEVTHTCPSIAVSDMKKILFEAFETIATGENPRTKRRRTKR